MILDHWIHNLAHPCRKTTYFHPKKHFNRGPRALQLKILLTQKMPRIKKPFTCWRVGLNQLWFDQQLSPYFKTLQFFQYCLKSWTTSSNIDYLLFRSIILKYIHTDQWNEHGSFSDSRAFLTSDGYLEKWVWFSSLNLFETVTPYSMLLLNTPSLTFIAYYSTMKMLRKNFPSCSLDSQQTTKNSQMLNRMYTYRWVFQIGQHLVDNINSILERRNDGQDTAQKWNKKHN